MNNRLQVNDYTPVSVPISMHNLLKPRQSGVWYILLLAIQIPVEKRKPSAT
jgi:hypothetical protein